MKRIIVGIMMTFALLFSNAATSMAQPSPALPAPSTTQSASPEGASIREPQLFFSRHVSNSRLSSRTIVAATGARGSGSLMWVARGTTSSHKAKSVLVPALCAGFIGSMPVSGGLFGNWFDIRSTVPLWSLTVIVQCPVDYV